MTAAGVAFDAAGNAIGAGLLLGVASLIYRVAGGRISRPVLRDLAAVAIFAGIYGAMRDAMPAGRLTVALARGQAIERAEHLVGFTAVQAACGHLLQAIPGGLRVAETYYGTAHLFVTLGVLVWVVANRRVSRQARWSLGLITIVAVAVIGLFPVAPPRLLPGHHGTIAAVDSALGLPYGAMPSVHIAWATWVALTVWAAAPRCWRWLGIVHLVITELVVLGTGNHYVVDTIAGGLLAAGSWALVGLAKARNHADPGERRITLKGELAPC